MAILRPEDFYHTGIVVDDLETATAKLSAIAGYQWTSPIDNLMTVWTAEGEATVRFRLVYSVDAPHLELVEHVPGTLWTPAPGNAVHHVGYFVDDLAASSDALSAAGLPVEGCGSVDGRRPAVFAYHKGSDGIRIEVVDHAVVGDFEARVRTLAMEPGRDRSR